MRFVRVVALLPFAAACGAQPLPVLTPEIAGQMPLLQLCEGTILFRPGNAEAAAAEVQRRGADCAPLYPAIQARLQAQPLVAPPLAQQQPLIPPLAFQPLGPKTTTCTTERFGAQLQTVCR